MSTQHSVILDSERHEAKGASTATSGTACFANGDGTTTFRGINYSDLLTGATSSGYRPELSVASVATAQTPTASNTALQIEFGPNASTSNVSISSIGAVTFTVAGQYIIHYALALNGGASGAILFIRVLVNGSPVVSTYKSQLSANITNSYVDSVQLNASIGDVLTIEMVYDSTGAGSGGLKQSAPTVAGWVATPTAGMVISKFKGIN